MSSIVTVTCLHFYSDWADSVKVNIDLDAYAFFEVDYRGENSWHIKGHSYKNGKWVTEELSDHQVYGVVSLADFIVAANKHKPKRCRVSRFNNLHYSPRFYSDLAELLKIVDAKEKRG